MSPKYRNYLRSWKIVLGFGIPFALCPLALDDDVRVRCGYVLLIMSLYWLFGLAPDSVTALLPIALFPILGVISTTKACLPYMKPAVMMMISGLIIAFAIEESNLHKRIALKLLLLMGTGVRKVLLGLMLTTMVLSFFISNTATTAMMLPITEAIVNELTQQLGKQTRRSLRKQQQLSIKSTNYEQNNCSHQLKQQITYHKDETVNITENNNNYSNLISMTASSERSDKVIKDLNGIESSEDLSINSSIHTLPNEFESKQNQKLRIAFFLSIAYASNIGGTGTLTGTGPNLVLQGIMDEYYPVLNDLSFASWMVYGMPGALILVLLSWLFLKYYYLSNFESNSKQSKQLQTYLRKRYNSLGRISFHESATSFCFLIILMLWFFRAPGFITGWEKILNSGTKINDATPALLILFIMFITPSNFKQFTKTPKPGQSIQYLINWRNVTKRMPWGVILLVGGGFSLAEGTINSGLSEWFGEQLNHLDIKSPRIFMACLTVLASIITEVTSNAACAAVILPVVNQAALSMKIHPLYFSIPVTIGVSFAFVLPVASPCNALVYEYLKIEVSEMIIPGLIVNIISLIVELILINTWGSLVFDFDHFPDWAANSPMILTSLPQTGDEQMMDPNSNLNAPNNMNQMTIINQVPANQIITQNQPMNQVSNQHLQSGQRMPIQQQNIQQNRMILTQGVQVRPGQIINNQNIHVTRMRPQHPNANIPMQQQMQQSQSNEYFQPNQVATNQMITQNPQSQTINPQFQQTNVPIQNSNNMNQMHNQMSNSIQMAPSPGTSYHNSYAQSPSSNIMGSPMSVNMVNQRNTANVSQSGASPNPTLNTPVMQTNLSPQMRQPTNDDQMYMDKLRQLSRFIEPLSRMLKNDSSDNSNESNKIKHLYNIITNQSKRVSYDVLLKCEKILESNQLFAIAQNQPSQISQTATITTQSSSSSPINVCASLMETIQSNYKKPNFNHTLQRTIGPAIAAITNNSYEYSTYKKSGSSHENLPDEDVVPHTIQGEIAKLDNKFIVDLDPLQHTQNKTLHLVCKIDDFDLPCVPPISIKVPMNDYPDLPPRCHIDKDVYSSSKFFQNIYTIFSNNLEKLPNLYSITTVLDRWELSIREASLID